MTWRRLALAAMAAAAIAVAAPARAGQAKEAPAGGSKASVKAPPDYVIGPTDVLEVLFWRDKDLSAEVIVRPDGKITLPLLNEIQAGGLTPEQLRLSVLDEARRFVEDPTATVVVKQINSRHVFIMGEVTKPGTYPLAGVTTVLQLLATAGGLTEFAARDEIVVLRSVDGQTVRHRVNYNAVVKGSDLAQNLALRPGDTVVVP
jgi:polysaccharide export outer membrane protein